MPDATREQRTTVVVKESPLSNLKQESIIKENRKQPRSLEGIEFTCPAYCHIFSHSAPSSTHQSANAVFAKP